MLILSAPVIWSDQIAFFFAFCLASPRINPSAMASSAATTTRIGTLSRAQLEELALALLDFQGAEDLQTWLARLEA